MPDFGFDAYALDDLDPMGVPPSLEVARDLIEAGKPRSALEILAEHNERLADDPDYLMLCGEAWLAAGHAPRAQHAFLGAIRVAPKDPRPLRLLGDLLVERGEKARARRVFHKAKRLALAETAAAPGAAEVDIPNDLIAAAERQERTRQAPFNPRQFLRVLAVVVVAGLLTSAIALIPEPAPESAKDSLAVAAVADSTSEVEVAPPFEKPAPAERAAVEVVHEPTVVTGEAPSAIPTVLEPVIEVSKPKPTAAPRAKKQSRPSAPPQRRDESPPVPTEADLDTELATSTDAAALTRRADAVSATAAAQFYRRALEIDPDYAPALVGIGRSLLRAEKYAEAMRNASRALQLARGVDARPGLEAEALYQIGRVHHQRGEEDTARQLLRQSISLPRTPAEAWFYLGESLSQDNSPAARDAYEQYLERKPNGHLADRARRAIQ